MIAGKEYSRDVTFGKRTIKEGECCVVWDRYGTQHLIVGPRLVHLFCSTIRFLNRIHAKVNEYLVCHPEDMSAITNLNHTTMNISLLATLTVAQSIDGDHV